ncbi:MAG: transcription termination factor NusA [Anaerolineae bacterium]|nr:transcription termination factor NusA [Anaerolineae bacterium]MDW8101354.1 transcription termination factor NusA [Anaerolineae bacterium]
MKNEVILAIKQLSEERKLPPDIILKAAEDAVASAYKKDYGPAMNVRAKIDVKTGQIKIFVDKMVVETVTNPKTQISLEEALKINPEARIGQMISVENTPPGFGRIAAQNARQVILQRIREAEKDYVYSTLADKEGELILGVIQKVDHATGNVIVNIDKLEAIMPPKERIPGEKYQVNQKMLFYIVEVYKSGAGPRIILSRAHKNFLKRLFEREVPEIAQGLVEIKAIAREAGSRSKVAVKAIQPGLDPIGTCVGQKGVRIQNIQKELNGEKVEVIEWSLDPAAFIANAMSPARVIKVILQKTEEGRTATVIVPDNQLSLAIGKEGQNARLVAKLTGWRIDIKSESEARAEGLLEGEEDKRDLLSIAQAILTGQKPEVILAQKAPPELPELESEQLPVQGETSPEPAEPEEVTPQEGEAEGFSLEYLQEELLKIKSFGLDEEKPKKRRK